MKGLDPKLVADIGSFSVVFTPLTTRWQYCVKTVNDSRKRKNASLHYDNFH